MPERNQDRQRYVGANVRRIEDPRLLRGTAEFVGDICPGDLVDVAFVRSYHARAKIQSIDLLAARGAEGVLDVVSAEDIADCVQPFTRMFYYPLRPSLERRYNVKVGPYERPVLASGQVTHVGEAVAAVVATDRYHAEDAAELVRVAYAPLPAVVDALEAAEDPSRVHCEFAVDVGDVDRAFARSTGRLRKRFHIGRLLGMPIETRGVVADYDSGQGRLTVWTNTQMPHAVRAYLAEMLKLDLSKIQVIKPEMGGSFGGNVYPEEILIPYLSVRLGRPVRWIEDRQEHLLTSRHSRDQWHDIEVAYEKDGTIVAVRDDFVVDSGAYNPFNITLSFNTAAHLRNQLNIAHMRLRGRNVLTNKAPLTPVRGAGRTEATFVIDRMVDMIAAEVGRESADVRAQNLIPAEEMPKSMGMLYRDGEPIVYDTGDYPAQLRAALTAAEYPGFRAYQRRLASEGRLVGLGISSYVEGSGNGPYEGAKVMLDASGRVCVFSGSSPHGQGHETTLAQVAADVLGVEPGEILVRSGDTSLLPYAQGTFASRSAVTAGSAVHTAAVRVRDRLVGAAATILEAGPESIEVGGGFLWSRENAMVKLSLEELAVATGPTGEAWAQGSDSVEATSYFAPGAVTWSSGTHVVVVEVDPELATVRVLRYVVVHDCGQAINPMIVEGQTHGGVALGLGEALFEDADYDSEGQFVNGSLMTYLLPTTCEVPDIEVSELSYPSPQNPLGAKGVGEGGSVSPPAAIVNAVVDALKPLAVELLELPLTPERLYTAIQRARDVAPVEYK